MLVNANSLNIPLADKCVNMCVTSPPYFGLRDYGNASQLGLEETPENYVENMVVVFREVRRVMRDDGTLWLNIGDSYYANRAANGEMGGIGGKSIPGRENHARAGGHPREDIKPKDLIGIPWMLAFALRADGWYLRSDIIWHKPNPMPESVTDRPTKSHEYIFLLAKQRDYYYDHEAIKEDSVDPESYSGRRRRNAGQMSATDKANYKFAGSIRDDGTMAHEGRKYPLRNKRSVWTVTTKSYKGAHFATFPPDLIKPCIKAGCPERGLVLDPFVGSGTTVMVAKSLGRNGVGIDLSLKYLVEQAKKRTSQEYLF